MAERALEAMKNRIKERTAYGKLLAGHHGDIHCPIQDGDWVCVSVILLPRLG